MARKKALSYAQDPALQLKTLALRDDPFVHRFRDIHYQLLIDSYQASGQRIASRETVAPLSDAKCKHLMKQHTDLHKRICKRYGIAGFEGGDPWLVKKKDWLATVHAQLNQRLTVETNWQTSFFSPAIRFHVIPENAKVYSSEGETIYQLPSLPKHPQAAPPLMTIQLDLSQVKPNALEGLAGEFKQAVKQCLTELPQRHQKPSASWQQNVDRDYRRFWQHFYKGVPYRWIAIFERSGEMPKRRVNVPIPTESSVRDCVERVHLILFRRRMRTSRRPHKPSKTALLETTLEQYNCPNHGRDCPISCQYGIAFIKNLQKIQ